MLDLLTQEYKDYTDEERQKMLMRIKSASKKTIDLLENLLTWARAQKGIIPYQPEKFNISELIQENVLLSEPAAHQKEILITQRGETNLIAIADVNMVNTIIRNLISNAVKFTFPGGNIIIDTGYHDADHILVKLQDTGLGMSEENMNNLFKIEKRMSMKGTNNEMGTGLGLILCKDLIEKNNGKIWVTSKEGVGSTFYISLPLYKHL
jgi:signal transduction histidine kinase